MLKDRPCYKFCKETRTKIFICLKWCLNALAHKKASFPGSWFIEQYYFIDYYKFFYNLKKDKLKGPTRVNET